MYVIAFLNGLIFYAPIATLYRRAVGVSILQITLIESISLILCIIMEIPWGFIADRIGYKKTLLISYWLYFISKIVFWKSYSFAGFLIERIILSVAMSGLSGCDVSILYLSCKKENSQKVFAIYNNLTLLGLLTASLTYSLFLGDNYRLCAFLTVLTYGIAAVLAFGLKEVKSSADYTFNPNNFKNIFISIFKDRRFLAALIGMAFLNETNQTITVFLNQLQYERSGIKTSAMGYIYIFVTLIGLLGGFSARLTKHIGSLRLTVMTFGAAGLACLVMVFTKNPILSIASIALLRLSYSLFMPLETELQNRQITTHDRATALSVYAVIIEGTGAATNILFGRTAQISLPFGMLSGAILCILGGSFVIRFLKQKS